MLEKSGAATRAMARYVAGIRPADLPAGVRETTKSLLLDWMGSALGGGGARPVHILEQFAADMGPPEGPSSVLWSGRRTSPLFAALVNGAASHVVEQDDLHSGAVIHPGCVVFPALLSSAEREGAGGEAFLAAAVAGYEVAIRVGRFLGRTHYETFHTTGTAGTLGAAAAVAHLLDLGEEGMLDALGSAGTQAAGLWAFLREGADSKQLHAGKAAADGVLAAYAAKDGLRGAHNVLESPQGMGKAMSRDSDPRALESGLGASFAVSEVSLKLHACCRHTHPSADALLALMRRHDVRARDIASVEARVHQAAIDVLGPVVDPRTVHQAKFSMGFVLGLMATRARAGVADFDEAMADGEVRTFMRRVTMTHDDEVESAYPERWIGKVVVRLTDGRTLEERVEHPRGDPAWPLTPEEIEEKAKSLAAYGGGPSEEAVTRLARRVWNLEEVEDISELAGLLRERQAS